MTVLLGIGRIVEMNRIAALLVMLIPGFLAAYGIKLMRDMVFGRLQQPFPYLWLQFLAGLILFAAGLAFVAGFIFYRDRKRNRVQDRFKQK
ncbi:YqzF protein [Bacillus sp. B-jedd]|nr:YqzF protein [Bacillus sp. B-jedd]